MSANPFTIFEKNPEVKDSLIKDYTAKKNQGDSLDYYHNGSPLNLLIDPKKIFIIFVTFLFIFFIILIRTFYLQIIKGEHYLSLAEGNRIKHTYTKANRGIIYDRNHEPLVKNKPNFILTLNPDQISSHTNYQDTIIQLISNEFGTNYQELEEIINQKIKSKEPGSLIIQDNIPYDQAIKLIITTSELKGLEISRTNQREYTQGPTFSHILGYLGKINQDEWPAYSQQGYSLIDQVGKSGLEIYYQTELRGQDGAQEIEVDASGQVKKILQERQVTHGHNIILSIDNQLQNFLTTQLESAVHNTPSSHAGAAVMINPNNGQILALTSLPTYDNNIFSKSISNQEYQALFSNQHQPLFNRAISGEYPPGSTFKLIVGSAALNEGIITPNTGFQSTGGIKIDKWFFPDWKESGHGYTQTTKAIAESVNTFFYYIGGGSDDFDGLGVDKIVSYAKDFNLNQPTGIDLPGESSGFLPSKKWKEENKSENWYIGDTYHLSIGQGDILATPLQVACYTSVFANRGTLYRPYLVKEITNINGQTIQQIQPAIISQNPVATQHIDTIRQGLRQAVTSGSAKSLNTLNIPAAGKTGTAQVSGSQSPHSWFTAFAPYNDPEIVITILVENGGEGSDTALTVAKSVIDYYFNTLTKE